MNNIKLCCQTNSIFFCLYSYTCQKFILKNAFRRICRKRALSTRRQLRIIPSFLNNKKNIKKSPFPKTPNFYTILTINRLFSIGFKQGSAWYPFCFHQRPSLPQQIIQRWFEQVWQKKSKISINVYINR